MNASVVHGLTLCVLLVIAPHAEHLPLWVNALCAVVLAWRTYLTHSSRALPKRGLLLVLTLASIAAVVAHFHSFAGREMSVTLLILLATLKLLELRTTRDAMAIIYLICFAMLTDFFYAQTIATAALVGATLLVLLTTWLHVQAPQIQLRGQARGAALLLLQAAPLMLVLFILFPRVQGPLWGEPQEAYNVSGLSDTMSPGSLGKLTLSQNVAFRATFLGKTPRRDQLYWRGPVLWNFDGRVWRVGTPPVSAVPTIDGTADVHYSVMLEPHNKKWLYALDMPSSLPNGASLSDDFLVYAPAAVTSRARYEIGSSLHYRANLLETESQRLRALQLPAKLNPQARQLAQSWRAAQTDDALLLQTALRYFNQQPFSYTLEPPRLGANGIDDFLFTTRQGFCEHYASALVFLMRAANIPARVVTGYLGGEYNALGNYTIVRQSDAHAWAEVWLNGQGWLRVDPTAAIAPERVQQDLSAALKDNTALPFMARHPPEWLSKLRLNLDALSNQWNSWVLDYNPERQFALLTRLGMSDASWQNMTRALMLILIFLLTTYALFLFRHRRDEDAVQAIWNKLCKHLAGKGWARAPHEGAIDYAERVAAQNPLLATPLRTAAQHYISLRYGSGDNAASLLPVFRTAVRAIIRARSS